MRKKKESAARLGEALSELAEARPALESKRAGRQAPAFGDCESADGEADP